VSIVTAGYGTGSIVTAGYGGWAAVPVPVYGGGRGGGGAGRRRPDEEIPWDKYFVSASDDAKIEPWRPAKVIPFPDYDRTQWRRAARRPKRAARAGPALDPIVAESPSFPLAVWLPIGAALITFLWLLLAGKD